jgi:hypothetical protein
VFAAVFLVRLVPLLRFTASSSLFPAGGDMHFYDEWAQRIAAGELTDHRAFYGLPLYPFFLAFLRRLAGYNPFVPAFLQVCADALTGLLMYRIAVRTFCSHGTTPVAVSRFRIGSVESIIGLIAVAGWALFVPAQAYSIILMPTAWLTVAFWFVVWQIVKRDDAPPLRVCGMLGLVIGAIAMGVATILFLVPLVVGAIALRKAQGSRITASLSLSPVSRPEPRRVGCITP